MPNEPRNGSVAAQKSFTDSLEPIIKDTYFAGKDAKAIGAALRNYWAAIRDLCEAAFEEPSDYVIQKTIGVGVFHKIFPRVSELATDGQGNRVLTQDTLESILGGLPQLESSFWRSGGDAARRGTGKVSVNYLAIELLEALEANAERKEQPMIL